MYAYMYQVYDKNVHSSIISKSQKLRKTHINDGMDKYTVVCSYN